MKVHSITFQSKTNPEKFGMFSSVSENAEAAKVKGLEMIKAQQGDLSWEIKMLTVLDITPQLSMPVSAMSRIVEKVEVPSKEIDLNKNWLMKTIIDNKDKRLFGLSKKYLSKPAILFIKEKLS